MIRPEDIQKQQFETGLMGYKTREVDDFLNLVCTDLKELYQEIDSLKRKVAAAELIAKDAKNHEDDFIASMAEDKKKSEKKTYDIDDTVFMHHFVHPYSFF